MSFRERLVSPPDTDWWGAQGLEGAAAGEVVFRTALDHGSSHLILRIVKACPNLRADRHYFQSEVAQAGGLRGGGTGDEDQILNFPESPCLRLRKRIVMPTR